SLEEKNQNNEYRNENRREKGPARRSGVQARRRGQAHLQHPHRGVGQQERQGEELRDRQRPLRDLPEQAEVSTRSTGGGVSPLLLFQKEDIAMRNPNGS